jgi:hypothetical protein
VPDPEIAFSGNGDGTIRHRTRHEYGQDDGPNASRALDFKSAFLII